MSADGADAVVVLDVGSLNTKAGFAGDAFSRRVFPSVVGRFRCPGLTDGFPDVYCGREAVLRRGVSQLCWPMQRSQVTNWEELEKLWHHAFYSELLVPPEDYRLMHAVSPLMPKHDKEKMSEILFESFTVPGLYLGSAPALALHASGRTSGALLELGHATTSVTPVFEGFPLFHAVRSSPINGSLLSDYLQHLLQAKGYSFTTPRERDLLERMKAEACYVAKDYEEELSVAASSGECDTRFELPDGQHVMLGCERFQCPELLLRPTLWDLTCPGLTDVLCSSIDSCDVDYRPLLYSNVVLSGGSSLFPGLAERLGAELAQRTQLGRRSAVDAASLRQHAVWTGGSILASLSILDGFWMTKEEYEEVGPDMVNRKFF